MRVLCLVLAFVLFFPASYAASAEDTLSALSRIEGADMTLYSLYSDYAGIDKDKSMEYAELFLIIFYCKIFNFGTVKINMILP